MAQDALVNGMEGELELAAKEFFPYLLNHAINLSHSSGKVKRVVRTGVRTTRFVTRQAGTR